MNSFHEYHLSSSSSYEYLPREYYDAVPMVPPPLHHQYQMYKHHEKNQAQHRFYEKPRHHLHHHHRGRLSQEDQRRSLFHEEDGLPKFHRKSEAPRYLRYDSPRQVKGEDYFSKSVQSPSSFCHYGELSKDWDWNLNRESHRPDLRDLLRRQRPDPLDIPRELSYSWGNATL